MAKIVSFTKSPAPSSRQARGHALDGFVDDGDLLEFSRPEGTQTQSAHPTSLFSSDWSNQELADLYRAHSLIQSAQPGLECDRGISDEGDPWFLIGDEKGDVLVHICRIKGTYILDSVALPKALHGKDFNALIEDFLTTVTGEQAKDAEAAQEPANVVRLARGGTVCLHPSMMIAALVWTLLMNADELTLPPSTGSNHKGLDQGQDRSQDTAQSDSEGGGVLADMPAPAAFNETLIKSEKVDIGADDLSGDLSTRAMITQIAQRDEKQLHVSAYSHALTTIAIAAGFYASADATDTFWKSTPADADTPASLGEIETREAQDQSTPLDHLSDALALLNSVVDLVVTESHADYAAANRTPDDESANALIPEDTGVMDASIGQQMLTMASEVFNSIAAAAQTNTADASGKAIKAAFDFEAANTVLADMGASASDKGLTLSTKETTSDGADDSIEGISRAYASSDVEVSRYDASSFKAGLGKFDGALQKYSDLFESTSGDTPEGNTSATDDEDRPPSSDTEDTFAEPSVLNAFDDAARSFIDAKIANADLEILVFDTEVIYLDKATFTGESVTVSWQLEDGGRATMIGLPSDMAEFLVA
ncbi:MAG: hypothetical protein FH759_15425 [Sediminimonas qiaohouensis]|uniref:Uncharacterized protein n=1 Tax=Sediminimonas qiaohouensis TaxID=552061 RepID=A0A7C9LCH4_9RHOB|nr:hypothetical protein [Sediminimonas qiaohouensis]MTJ06057.1 hypothetical protein [Sediminimonas qiaohouensis]